MKHKYAKQLVIVFIAYFLLIWGVVYSVMKMYPHTHPEKQHILLKNENTDISKPE